MRVAVFRLLPILVAFFLWCGFSQASAADNSASAARRALEISTDRILTCIKNPDYVNPVTRPPLRRQIEEEVLHIFDFAEFSSRTVGQRWRSFTPEQQQNFSDAFADLLITTYVSKIDGYNGENVAYAGETASGDKVEVRTVITMKDGKKVPVSYRMLPKGNAWRVYDVLIENVSLVKNYRDQFKGILNKDTPESLIERIRNKVKEVRQQHATK
ncbi:MAG: ABC transporter substrate-binding protein [Desulfovibrio sp.]|jgi:phospholipid transport system substrate-binding protein|nr:ABC transporter substrate-binding protein [Desulfovibrio sp.]